MDNDRFFTYSFEVLDAEFEETESLYRRFPMAITANVALVGATFFLMTDAYLAHVFRRPDAFLYYFFGLISLLGSIASICLLAASILTRKYKNVSSLFEIDKYRADHDRSQE